MPYWGFVLEGDDRSLLLDRKLGDSELKVVGLSRPVEYVAVELLCCRGLPALLELPGLCEYSGISRLLAVKGLVKTGETGLSELE
jgi:hypothetical protein